ncbi:glycosyltransferase family 2 protein [Desulfoluna sp.]|uniref:glycosyltransferase n=1 Tax=Desulfoluna sp. TaxID=2045199 RepID=UPI002610792C|nr:glycosyltransferase family 2 protein [Desulfoluna sp.]
MNSSFLTAVYVLHLVSVLLVALYGVHRLALLRSWLRMRGRPAPPVPRLADPLPKVTVQLPLYNEEAVAERLLAAAGELSWPRDRLEIQVLDDSTDGTREAVDRGVARLRADGFFVSVLRRSSRHGFKAGALAEGLAEAGGAFLAVFDADFIPPTDFLLQTVPRFTSPDIGMVQARWGFLNDSDSLVTGVQALTLSSHFDIEHGTRHALGRFFNFNGTAGVWRKEAIVGAGGWRADTVTEDLDLSYRAQLAGWRLVYHGGCVAPSELPPTLTDFISQQQRWTKGASQTAVKILPRLLAAPLPLRVKVEALFHLLGGMGWLAGALATVTLWPALLVHGTGSSALAWVPGVAALTGSCGAILFYYMVYALLEPRTRHLLRYVPLLPLICIGVAPFLACAAVEGLFTRHGVFHRTPKYGRLIDGMKGDIPYVKRDTFRRSMVAFSLLAVTASPLLFVGNTLALYAFPLAMAVPAGYMLTGVLLVRERAGGRG